MSEYTLKPALDQMPPELLRLIIRDTSWYDRDHDDDYCLGAWYDHNNWHSRRWLAPTLNDPFNRDQRLRQLLTLRAVSETCKRLRVYVLALLWKSVEVRTVDELGRLQQILRLSLSNATYICSFSFTWNVSGYSRDRYPFDYGTASSGYLLQLAFRNRGEVWQQIGEEFGCKILHRYRNDDTSGESHNYGDYIDDDAPRFFGHGDTEHEEPSATSCDGPDGKGEDKLIKNPEDFNNCVIEVVSRLTTSVDTFEWLTPVAVLPTAAFDALVKLVLLKCLKWTSAFIVRGRRRIPSSGAALLSPVPGMVR